MDYGEKRPILIKEREIQATQSSPVITYKLSEEELERYRKMTFKNDKKKPVIPAKRKQEVKKMEDKKVVKKLTMENIKDCLSRGMTAEQIAQEYEKDERIVRMLIAKMNKPAKKTADESVLKITSLRGSVDYYIDYEKDKVTIKNKTGQLKICAKDIKKLITELEELQKIVS